MEVAGLVLGVLGPAQEVIQQLERLRDRHAACTANPAALDRLLSAYRELDADLRALHRQLRGAPALLEDENRAMFEWHMHRVRRTFGEAQQTLADVNNRMQRRGVLRRFIRALSVEQECARLNEFLSSIRAVLLQVNSYVGITNQIAALRISSQRAPDGFRGCVAVRPNARDVVLDFDAKDAEGKPATLEGQLKEALLACMAEPPAVVAVVGMGGSGKTCAMLGLAADADVRDLFRDGLYLITLGMDATMQTTVHQLCGLVRLSGGPRSADAIQKEQDLDDVVKRVAAWFESRKFLILLDDVWNCYKFGTTFVRHMLSVIAAGAGSALVFTTREHEMALEGSPSVVRFFPRDPRGAVARRILLRCASFMADNLSDPSACKSVEELLKVCAGLPVALAIVGKAVALLALNLAERRERAWVWFLSKHVNCAEKVLGDDIHGYKNLGSTVLATLRILDEQRVTSLSFVPKLSFDKMFRALCVLRKQEIAPASTLRHLWCVDRDEDAIEILHMFARVSLVNMRLEECEGSNVEALVIHDVLLDFAKREAEERGEVIQSHERLLNGYNMNRNATLPRSAGSRAWYGSGLDTDPYFQTHVCRHLLLAERAHELVNLLLSPEWTIQQLASNGILQVVEDFQFGDKAAREMRSSGAAPSSREMGDALALICEAARLSSAFVSAKASEAWFQIHARLLGKVETSATIRCYVKRIEERAPRPFLKCENPLLKSPGGQVKNLILIPGLCAVAGSMIRENVICGYEDGRVAFVDIVTGTATTEWAVSEEAITCISVTQDGSRVVVGGKDKTVRVLDAASGALLTSYNGHMSEVVRVAVSPDARKVISGENVVTTPQWFDETLASNLSDGVVGHVWDMGSGERTCPPLVLSKGRLGCLAVSPDGGMVALAAESCKVSLMDITTGEKTRDDVECHKERVSCLFWVPETRRVISGSDDGTIKMWDAESDIMLCEFEGHRHSVSSIAFLGQGQIASASSVGDIRNWDIATGREIGPLLRGHTGDILGLLPYQGKDELISCGKDESILVWDLRHSSSDSCSSQNTAAVTTVTLSPDEAVAASATHNCVQVWDALSARPTGGLLQVHGRSVRDVVVTADGKLVAAVNEKGKVFVWDLHSGELLRTVEVPAGRLAHAAFIPGRDMVIWACSDGKLRICEFEKAGDCASEVTANTNTSMISRMVVSGDGKHVAVYMLGGIRVWATDTGHLVRQVSGIHPSPPADLFPLHVQGDAAEARGSDMRTIGRLAVDDDDARRIVLHEEREDEPIHMCTLESPIACMAVSRRGKRVCAGLGSGQVAFMTMLHDE